MTIYDALSQEHGLLIYHDYLLDNNQELLSDMCLSDIIELEQMYIRSRTGSKSKSRSRSRTWVGSSSISSSRSWSGSRSGRCSRSLSGFSIL